MGNKASMLVFICFLQAIFLQFARGKSEQIVQLYG